MMFTPSQLSLIASVRFDVPISQVSPVVDFCYEFINLGDPYTEESLIEAVNLAQVSPEWKDEEQRKYLISKCAYWFSPTNVA